MKPFITHTGLKPQYESAGCCSALALVLKGCYSFCKPPDVTVLGQFSAPKLLLAGSTKASCGLYQPSLTLIIKLVQSCFMFSCKVLCNCYFERCSIIKKCIDIIIINTFRILHIITLSGSPWPSPTGRSHWLALVMWLKQYTLPGGEREIKDAFIDFFYANEGSRTS